MTVKSLTNLLKQICNSGFGNWTPCFNVFDDEKHYVNHIFCDEDGKVCLQSTDCEEDAYNLQTWKILTCLKKYNPNKKVYFQKEYYSEDTEDWNIKYKWYHSRNDDGDGDDVFIDCVANNEYDNQRNVHSTGSKGWQPLPCDSFAFCDAKICPYFSNPNLCPRPDIYIDSIKTTQRWENERIQKIVLICIAIIALLCLRQCACG
ncbi:MAG: hypothetical protein J6T60_00770 [Bacteroidales bacterium]|nr:hypothetical protein [Bacteroidales bacterium]